MNKLYEIKISDARWMAYDIPGNIGWIIYITCTVLALRNGISVFSLLSCIPALLMLTGVAELISERIKKLDRILPRIRVLRGFGALTLGGILGTAVSIIGLIAYPGLSLPWWMLGGSLLCGVFAGLLFAGYQQKRTQAR